MAVAAPPAPAPSRTLADVPPAARTLARLAVLAAVAAGYALLGARVVADHGAVAHDALERLARAALAWHGSPAKLAAIGFAAPPLPTIALLPLAAFVGLERSLLALVVTSALLGALTLALLERTLARCELAMPVRLALLAAVAVNPLFAYAASGDVGLALTLALLALALHGLVAWAASREPRHLATAGLGFGLLVLSGYAFALWALGAALAVASTLAARRGRPVEVEGSVLALTAPAVYALAAWTLFDAVIAGHAFGWVGVAQSGPPIGAGAVGDRLLGLAVGGFPLAFAVVPGLAALARARRDALAGGLAGLVVLGVAILAVEALAAGGAGPLALSHALPIALAALVGAAWAHRIAGALRPLVWVVALAALVVGIFTAWRAMQTSPVRGGEAAFVRAVRGEPLDALAGERTMARALAAAGAGPARVLVDETAHPAAIALSGRPGAFLTEVNAGTARWRAALAHPAGRVDLLLLGPGDRLARRFPRLAAGLARPGFAIVLRTRGEVLVRVLRPPRAAPHARRPAPSAAGTIRPARRHAEPSAPGSARPPGRRAGPSAPRALN